MEPLGTQALLDRNDIAGIFSNIQEIRAVNSALLQQLEQSANLSAQTVGEIFSKMVLNCLSFVICKILIMIVSLLFSNATPNTVQIISTHSIF